MLYLTFFFTVTLVVYTFFVLREERRLRMKRRMALITEDQVVPEPDEQENKQMRPLLTALMIPIWKQLKRSFRRKLPGEKEARMELKLLQAGRPLGMSPIDYRLLQTVLFLLLPILSGLYSTVLKLGIGGVSCFVLLGMGMAILIPHYYLHLRIKNRCKLALKELPDVLDLLTVNLEAGLGFDSALSKLVAKKEGVLASELQRCLEEIRLGKTRREALLGVKERLPLDELKVLISSILQAEKLGIGMVQVLRVQSHEVREQRKQRAEEEAMKAPIKMLFPLVLFIFPSLFIVLLGPALIQFLETFSK